MPVSKERSKELREQARAEGRCIVCRARPAQPGSSSCTICLERSRLRRAGPTSGRRPVKTAGVDYVPQLPFEQRFWSHVDKKGPDDCWLWTAAKLNSGYGQVYNKGKAILAHRASFVFANGPIPEGKVLDHICRNRLCVNPAHLRAVTNRENVLAPGSESHPAVNVQKTHCPAGHKYSIENTYLTNTGGRDCRQCQRERQATIRKGHAGPRRGRG